VTMPHLADILCLPREATFSVTPLSTLEEKTLRSTRSIIGGMSYMD
jgi:hypothetical protein